jgi:hypothetical protein
MLLLLLLLLLLLQARQAFGLGSDVFVASNLDAHEATIKELGNFAAPLKAIEKATGQFNQDTAGEHLSHHCLAVCSVALGHVHS